MLFRAPESHPRSLVKAVSWRLLGSVDTFILSLLVTHKPWVAASIASAETVTKIVLYYFHERIWAAVPWGRTKAIEPQEPAKPERPQVLGLAPAVD